MCSAANGAHRTSKCSNRGGGGVVENVVSRLRRELRNRGEAGRTSLSTISLCLVAEGLSRVRMNEQVAERKCLEVEMEAARLFHREGSHYNAQFVTVLTICDPTRCGYEPSIFIKTEHFTAKFQAW